MTNVIREYDAKTRRKKRITLRNVLFDYYHVSEYKDGKIILDPRELTTPFQISTNSLSTMDNSIQNMKEGKVSEKIDLSEFADDGI